jgi:hypothetical protein
MAIGQTAIVVSAYRPDGQMKLLEEVCEARCTDGAGPGDEVVIARERLARARSTHFGPARARVPESRPCRPGRPWARSSLAGSEKAAEIEREHLASIQTWLAVRMTKGALAGARLQPATSTLLVDTYR